MAAEEETPRDIEEELDQLDEQGEDMEERLEEAGSEADDVHVPDPEDASGGGIQASDLVDDEDEQDSDGE